MFKLLIAEIKRYLQSICFISEVILLFLIHMIQLKGFLPFISWGTNLLENTSQICIITSILTSIYIGNEFSYKTIQSKILLGYNRQDIYLSYIFSLALGNICLVIIDTIFYTIGSIIWKIPFNQSSTFIIVNTLVFASTIGCISIIACSLSLLLKSKNLLPIILFVISIYFLSQGKRNLNVLTDSKAAFVEAHMENSEDAKELIHDSKGNITDSSRTNLNFRISISPYGQCSYATYISVEQKDEKKDLSFLFKNNPYHLDFLLFNTGWTLSTIFIGIYIFKKQNI